MKNQNSSSGKKLGLSAWRNDELISPFWEKATFKVGLILEVIIYLDGIVKENVRTRYPLITL